LQSFREENAAEAGADGRVVIDEEHGGRGFFHGDGWWQE